MMRHGKEFEILRKCCKGTEIQKSALEKVRSKQQRTMIIN